MGLSKRLPTRRVVGDKCLCGSRLENAGAALSNGTWKSKTGTQPVKVHAVCPRCGYVSATYVKCGMHVMWSYKHLIPYNDDQNSGITDISEKKEMSTLYEIKKADGTVVYGMKHAVNQLGKWIMELKGSGEVLAVDKADCTEVTPYTVMVHINSGSGKHYITQKDAVVVGDVLVLNNSQDAMTIGLVTAVNTKAKNASVLKASKLSTTPIAVVDDE